jgi:hypothetical protein
MAAKRRSTTRVATPVAGHGRDLSAGAKSKVSWFFSSEKNILCISQNW